eukprot:352712-Chlamydomonas_euryale.AAC.10
MERQPGLLTNSMRRVAPDRRSRPIHGRVPLADAGDGGSGRCRLEMQVEVAGCAIQPARSQIQESRLKQTNPSTLSLR